MREWLKTCGRLVSQSWSLFWMHRKIRKLKRDFQRKGLDVVDGGKKSRP